MKPVNFKPSQVSGFQFAATSFRNLEKECWATIIAEMMTNSDDQWLEEFSWKQLGQAALDCQIGLIPSLLTIKFQDLINHLWDLIAEGYVTKEDRDGQTYFKLTDKMMEFYEAYAK